MLPALISSCSHPQVSIKALYNVKRSQIFDEKAALCYQHGFRSQDPHLSLKTHASNHAHMLVVETPDLNNSVDSKIFSPYPNEFDDIVRSLPKDYLDKKMESKCFADSSVLYPVDTDVIANAKSSTSFSIADASTSGLDSVSGAVELSKKSLSGFQTGIGSSVAGVSDSINAAVGEAQETFERSIGSLKSLVLDKVKGVTDSFDSVVSGVGSSADKSKGQASGQLTGLSNSLKESVYAAVSLSADVLRKAIISAENALGNAAVFVQDSYGSAKSLLPPDVRQTLSLSEEKVVQVTKPIGVALHQVYAAIEGLEKILGLDPTDPLVQFVVLVTGWATVGISYWLLTYGGYSGDLTPEATLELLKNDNAVLIDVRPEDLREKDGVPDLRRRARSKYATVVLPELDASTRRLLKGGNDVYDALLAAVIRNLKIVKDGSKVIIMDASGDRSKAIARSLTKLGVKNAYLVQGGYRSWVRNGLRIKDLKPETALTVLNEEAEAIIEDIKLTPTLVFGYLLGLSAVSYALLEWEKTLQIIAIIGVSQTIYRRVASYESSADLKADVRLLLSPVEVGAQAFSWAATKLEPNKIGLPTSPSSSAVRERVVQAAAKHESQPSDVEEGQSSPQESLDQTIESLNPSET